MRPPTVVGKVTVRLALAATMMVGVAASHALEDVPFITTPDNVTLAMLDLARVTKRDHVIDLGSGDGRIVITAAKRYGASGLGVEIVEDLVKQSIVHAKAARVTHRVSFENRDLFKTPLERASVVTMYLLPDVNLQLRPKLLALKPGTRVVSHDWDMGDWQPDRTVMLKVPDKKVGLEKSSKVHLWVVPANIAGAWCGTKDERLTVTQRYQRVHVEASVMRAKDKLGRETANTPNSPHLSLDGAFSVDDGRSITVQHPEDEDTTITVRALGKRLLWRQRTQLEDQKNAIVRTSMLSRCKASGAAR